MSREAGTGADNCFSPVTMSPATAPGPVCALGDAVEHDGQQMQGRPVRTNQILSPMAWIGRGTRHPCRPMQNAAQRSAENAISSSLISPLPLRSAPPASRARTARPAGWWPALSSPGRSTRADGGSRAEGAWMKLAKRDQHPPTKPLTGIRKAAAASTTWPRQQMPVHGIAAHLLVTTRVNHGCASSQWNNRVGGPRSECGGFRRRLVWRMCHGHGVWVGMTLCPFALRGCAWLRSIICVQRHCPAARQFPQPRKENHDESFSTLAAAWWCNHPRCLPGISLPELKDAIKYRQAPCRAGPAFRAPERHGQW